MSYLRYWDLNNLYGWALSKKLHVNSFKWVEIFLNLIKNFVQKNKEGYFLEVDNLHNFQNNLPFLPERMKIEKVEKLVADLHDKNEHAIHVRNLKQALNHGVVLEKCVE